MGKYSHFPQKIYKLSRAKFSHFDRMRGDKNQIFHTIVPSQLLTLPFTNFASFFLAQLKFAS